MDMRLQHILTRQHTPTLRSIGLRMYSRHTVTAAGSASGLGTITFVATVATTAGTLVIMEEITAGTTVAMADILEVTAAVTVATVATTESIKLRPFIPGSSARQVSLAEFFYGQ